MVEGSACICSHPTWKPASHAMMAKVLQTASWVPMHLLPWVQCKRWTPIKLMQYVHTNQKIPTIQGCGSPKHIKKTKENN
jgi:hypothetical protein